MLRLTLKRSFFGKLLRLHAAPIAGYEVIELPCCSLLDELVQSTSKAEVIAVLHQPPDNALWCCGGVTQSTTIEICSQVSSDPKRYLATVVEEVQLGGASKQTSSSAQSHSKQPSSLPAQPKKFSFIESDELLRSFISSFSSTNLGRADDVVIATVPILESSPLIAKYNLMTFPTTLLFLHKELSGVVAGARVKEVGVKSLFLLRADGRDILSLR